MAISVLALAPACKRKHVTVDTQTELPYPACAEDAGTEVVAKGDLRSGPLMRERDVVEHYALTKTGCGFVFEGRQEWPLQASDVEVVYDADLRPLRAWKRMTIPGSSRADGSADIRRYELRTPEVGIKRKNSDGEIVLERLLPSGKIDVPQGARVGAVVGPGRGVLTAWIRRAKLAPGQSKREVVLDFRAMVEVLEIATIARDADRFEPSLGKNLRVYTIYGHDTVFADETDAVVGDLAGLRPSASLETPPPAPLPTFGQPDPVHTP